MDSTPVSVNAQTRDLELSAFERPQQIDEYIAALEQRVLPFKFAYVGLAAHTHDELVRSREYGLADVEAALIRDKFALSILPKLNGTGLNVIDVGAGNGMKGLLVLEVLHQKFSSLKYVALDYSETLLRVAMQNISTRLPWLNMATYQIDFQACSFGDIIDKVRAETSYPSLLLFLGHTLGNPIDHLQALSNIRDSMRVQDNLLVGVELYQPDRVDEMLQHYRNEPFYQAIFKPLTFAGLQRDDGVLEVSFNESTRNVEVHFELAKDICIRISTFKELELKRRERLLIGLSHRFDKAELREMFSRVGLHIRDLVLDDDCTYVLVLVTVDGYQSTNSTMGSRS